jgi:hypothetical protein
VSRSLKLWSKRVLNVVWCELKGNCPLAELKRLTVRGKRAGVVVRLARRPVASGAKGVVARKLKREFCDAVTWKIEGSLRRLTKVVSSWLKRSTEVKKKVLSALSGPPSEPPYCCRLKSDLPEGLKSKALRASNFSSRKRPKTLPFQRLAPDFETMLTMPPEAPPNSAL